MNITDVIAVLLLISASIGIGFLIGVADRKWWRGPKPPADDGEAFDEMVDMRALQERLTKFLDGQDARDTEWAQAMTEWRSEPAKIAETVRAAIAESLPTEEKFRSTVATMVQMAASVVNPVKKPKVRRRAR